MKQMAGRLVAPTFLLAVSLSSLPASAVEPANVRLGPLYLTPTLDIEQLHTDNLFRTENGEIDTWGTIVTPRVQLWAQEDLDTYSATYEMVDGYYYDSSEDDFTDHKFRLDVHKEVSASHIFDLYAKYYNLNEERGTGLSEGDFAFIPDKPLKYDLGGYGARYTLGNANSKGRLEFKVQTEEIKYKNFRDFTRAYDRDQDSYGVTFFYRVGGRTEALFELRRADIDYRVDTPVEGGPAESLDSDEDAYLVGLSWEATANTTGSVRLGAYNRSQESAVRKDKDGFQWEVELTWEPRTFTTFQVSTQRFSSETNGFGDSVDTQEHQLSWQYDWSSRISTEVRGMLARDEYPGSARQDDRYEFEARVDYNFRLWFDVGTGYRYEERSSDVDSLDYTRNEFFVDVKLSL